MSNLDLASLLTIWPIAESFATHLPVGDLITLSRTSTSLRTSLHGNLVSETERNASGSLRQNSGLDPRTGHHQTNDWVHLKSIAPFLCYDRAHVRGRTVEPCIYCSRPICDACIIRDCFKHPQEKSFRNRWRYFCKDCWTQGRPTRSFRYPALKVDENGELLRSSTKTRNEEDVDDRDEADQYCGCRLMTNGWFCSGCKQEQNSSPLAQTQSSSTNVDKVQAIQCYGLRCDNIIDASSPDKDRRRVCLWCQKPLRRQYGGEDRHAWNLMTIEARARNAESRSRDIEEYNRNRLQRERMSRHELRNTRGPDDDKPIFVRHLDTVNYRNFMPHNCVPDPQAVYKSKNRYWKHEMEFLKAVGQRCLQVKFENIGGVSVEDMSSLTQDGALPFARLNQSVTTPFLLVPSDEGAASMSIGITTKRILEFKFRVLYLHLRRSLKPVDMAPVIAQQYECDIEPDELQKDITKWLPEAKVMYSLDRLGQWTVRIPTRKVASADGAKPDGDDVGIDDEDDVEDEDDSDDNDDDAQGDSSGAESESEGENEMEDDVDSIRGSQGFDAGGTATLARRGAPGTNADTVSSTNGTVTVPVPVPVPVPGTTTNVPPNDDPPPYDA